MTNQVESTIADRNHYFFWLLGVRRCPVQPAQEFLSLENPQVELFRAVGLLPSVNLCAPEGKRVSFFEFEASGYSPLLLWSDPLDLPPLADIGDVTDKWMQGLRAYQMVGSTRVELVASNSVKRRKAQRGRASIDDVHAAQMRAFAREEEKQAEFFDPQDEISDEDAEDEAWRYIRLDAVGDDPQDRAEAIREIWSDEFQSDYEDSQFDEDGMFDKDGMPDESPTVAYVPPSTIQLPHWIAECASREAATLLMAARSDALRNDLAPLLAGSLLTEWLLTSADHSGDWSAAILGYCKCLERVLVHDLRAIAKSLGMPAGMVDRLSRASLGMSSALLMQGVARAANKNDREFAILVTSHVREWLPAAQDISTKVMRQLDPRDLQQDLGAEVLRMVSDAWVRALLRRTMGDDVQALMVRACASLFVVVRLRNDCCHVRPSDKSKVRLIRTLLLGRFQPFTNPALPLFGIDAGIVGMFLDQGAARMRDGATWVSRDWAAIYDAYRTHGSSPHDPSHNVVWDDLRGTQVDPNTGELVDSRYPPPPPPDEPLNTDDMLF